MISRSAAEAAVAVRPNLAEVGWFDALLTQHFADWVFYHYPAEATTALTAVPAVLVGAWIYLSSGDSL